MKKILLLFLLIFSVTTQAQTHPVNPTKFGKISINTNVATASTTRINSQDPITNEINYIDAVNLPVPTSVINAIKQKADLSTGLLKNGLISINADPTKFNISAGIGIISNFDDPENPVSTIINFPAFTGITPTYLTSGNITYIAINSTPAIVMQATPFTDAQRRDLIILGAAIHSNLTNINVVNNISAPSNAIGNQLHDFMEAVGALNITGNKYTANGANLSLNKSAGTIFKFGVNFATNWKDPHILSQSSGTALTFRYRTQNGTEGSDVTVINPAVYDLNNVLTAVPNNKFSIQTVTMFQTGLTRIQYGQAVYDDLASAQAAIFTRDYNVEANIKENGITRSYIIVKNNATSLQNAADSRIIEAQKFGGVASGGVALTFANIVSALGYTPENVSNKQNSLSVDGTGVKYPTVDAVNLGLNNKINNTPKPYKGLLVGDSTIASYLGDNGIDFYLLENSDIQLGSSIVNQAVPGQTINEQLTVYNADTQKATYDFIIVQIGLNDLYLYPAETETALIAKYQTLINTINSTKKQSAIIITSCLLPAKQRWIDLLGVTDGAIAQNKWTKLNEAIMGGGSNPILNASFRINEHVEPLSDGVGNLAFVYDKGDHLHENNQGRSLIASSFRNTLFKAGIFTVKTQNKYSKYFSNTNNNVFLKDGVLNLVNTVPENTYNMLIQNKNNGGMNFSQMTFKIEKTDLSANQLFSLGVGNYGNTSDLAENFYLNHKSELGVSQWLWKSSGNGDFSIRKTLKLNTVSSILGEPQNIVLFDNTISKYGISVYGALGGMDFASNQAGITTSFRWFGGSNTPNELMRLNANGNFIVGGTTDDTVNKFQVTGSARISNLSGTGTRTVVADASGNLSAGDAVVSGVKRYKALISQTGTSAPTVIVLENSLGTVNYTYSSTGVFGITSSALFTTNKTFPFIVPNGNGTVINGINVFSSSQLYINSTQATTGAAINGTLDKTPILIEVYP